MKFFITTLTIALIAMVQVHGYSSGGGGYGSHSSGGGGFGALSSGALSASGADASTGGFQLQGASAGGDSASAGAQATAGDGPGSHPHNFGSSQNIPYAPQNTRGNSVSSSITYPNNKGEILIHRPAAIIVKRPPTRVLVNHPPLVVKPAPVVLHKPPAVVLRKVLVKHHPRPVKVEPVYVNVVKPPAEKYFVNEKQQQYGAPQPSSYAPVSVGPSHGAYSPSSAAAYLPHGSSGAEAGASASAGVDNAALNKAGYQLVQGNRDLAALANYAGTGGYGAHHSGPAHSGPSY